MTLPAAHRIDTHHHIVPPRYLQQRRSEIERIAHVHMPKMAAWSPQVSLDAMDRAGVATSITSISSPGCWFGEAADSISISRTLWGVCRPAATRCRRQPA